MQNEDNEDNGLEFNELPYEIVYTILETLPFSEQNRLRVVCKYWQECLDRIIQYTTWEDLTEERNLNLVFDEARPEQPNAYSWFMRPNEYAYELEENETYPNLFREFGVALIYYTFGAGGVPENCEYFNADDTPEEKAKKRLRWAQHRVKQEIGELKSELVLEVTERFIKERLDIFNSIYPLQITAVSGVPMFLAMRTNKSFHIEFTTQSFMSNQHGHNPNDFKMYVKKDNKGEWVWEGLGDNWEEKTARQVMECFAPKRTNETQLTFQGLCVNQESNTISHLFEAIIYLTEMHLLGKTIIWDKPNIPST